MRSTLNTGGKIHLVHLNRSLIIVSSTLSINDDDDVMVQELMVHFLIMNRIDLTVVHFVMACNYQKN